MFFRVIATDSMGVLVGFILRSLLTLFVWLGVICSFFFNYILLNIKKMHRYAKVMKVVVEMCTEKKVKQKTSKMDIEKNKLQQITKRLIEQRSKSKFKRRENKSSKR